MEYYRLVKQIIHQDIRTVGVARTPRSPTQRRALWLAPQDTQPAQIQPRAWSEVWTLSLAVLVRARCRQ